MDDNKDSMIKNIRKKYKFTQLQVSKVLGISVRNYRDKERKKASFTQEEIMRLIELFDLNERQVYEIFYLDCLDSTFYNDEKHIGALSVEQIKKSIKNKWYKSSF